MSRLPRIAYLTGQYPEVSLTFIQREIEALRALGFEVMTCSIRQTPPEQHPGPAERAEAARTFKVLNVLKSPMGFLAGHAYLLKRPRAYFGALRLAWQTRSPGLQAAALQLIYFLEALVLARHLEANRIDHLHNHFTFGACTVAMMVQRLTGIPYSFTLHGPADLLQPYRWALKEKVSHAAFVATISHYARSQIMFFADPAHWSKVQIIHCGVKPDKYGSHEPAPDTSTETRVVSSGGWPRPRAFLSFWTP